MDIETSIMYKRNLKSHRVQHYQCHQQTLGVKVAFVWLTWLSQSSETWVEATFLYLWLCWECILMMIKLISYSDDVMVPGVVVTVLRRCTYIIQLPHRNCMLTYCSGVQFVGVRWVLSYNSTIIILKPISHVQLFASLSLLEVKLWLDGCWACK